MRSPAARGYVAYMTVFPHSLSHFALHLAMAPNPSFHTDGYGWLRQPPHAGELKRWASHSVYVSSRCHFVAYLHLSYWQPLALSLVSPLLERSATTSTRSE